MASPEASAASGGGASTDEILGNIEKLYKENNHQRSLNQKVMIAGAIIIFIVLLQLCLRLYGIFDNYNKYTQKASVDNIIEVLGNPEADLKLSEHDAPEIDDAIKSFVKLSHERITPSIKHSQRQLVTKILPDFSDRVTSRFAERRRDFETEGTKMFNNVRTHAEKQFKAELVKVLIDTMEQTSAEVRKQFPGMTDRKLSDELKSSEAYFYDELHSLGMTKIAKFDPVLRGLKNHIDRLGKENSIPPKQREEIVNEFLEGLFDRMKYEFVPGLGDQLVAPPKAVEGTKGGME